MYAAGRGTRGKEGQRGGQPALHITDKSDSRATEVASHIGAKDMVYVGSFGGGNLALFPSTHGIFHVV